MPINPLLLPGYEAYLRGEYVQALIAWEEPWKALTGDDRELCLALIRLAGALHHQWDRRWDSATHLYDSARNVLAGLPDAVLGVNVARLRKELPPTVDRAAAAPPRLQAAPRIPPRLLLRFLALVLIVGTGFAVFQWSPLAEYLNKDAILALFERLRGTWWAPVLLVLSFVVLCTLGVPATPMLVAGGMVWGVLWGSVYNVLGTFLGAATTYWLGRVLGRDFVLHLFGRKLRRVERMVARRGGFWSLAGVRFLPLPFALVNYCAAFVGIRPGLFLSSTFVGLALTVPFFTYFAHALSRAATGARSGVFVQLGIAMALFFLVTFLPRFWQARKRRERYRELLARRQGRRGVVP
ncbi:MAG TPA: DUF309 domain-containing protein [Thermoanaerobaculia bacterium]|nr:DUF309 domain-containing protein [Thermoanaerobaculia bacterium]